MSFAEAQYTIDGVIDGLQTNPPPIGLAPNNLKDLKIIGGEGHVYINFTPTDTFIEENLIVSVGGVMIRRKIGGFPENEKDGDLIADLKGEDAFKYSTQPYMDENNVVNDTEYYYRLFPYSSYNVFNRSMANSGKAFPHKCDIWGFRQDFTNLDPDTCITYLKNAADYNPMRTNVDLYTHSLGSWENWKWLQKNLPYTLDASGNITYKLNPDNYHTDVNNTTTLASSSYDNTNNWFAWIPKIYMKEIYADDGNSREVYFSLTRDPEGETYDYIPVGFLNKNNEEMEGIWLAMYHVGVKGDAYNSDNTNFFICANPDTSITSKKRYVKHYAGLKKTLQYIKDKFGDRGVALGGPIMNVFRDLLYMLYKSTDVQKHAGYGLSGAYSLSMYTIDKDVGQGFNGFWGKSGSSSNVCVFHSNVLMSFIYPMLDPYTIIRNGEIYMSPNYNDDLANSGASYAKTGVKWTSQGLLYPSKLTYLGDGLGSFPIPVNPQGSSDTGLCDYIRLSSTNGNFALGRGKPNLLVNGTYNRDDYKQCGPAAIDATRVTSIGDDEYNSADSMQVMLLPDPGFIPS